MQLEDGSTAYIQHTVHMPPSNTILAIQADGTIADLQAEATALDPDTISVLEQYTTKVNTACHSSSGHVTWLNYAAFPFHLSFLLFNVFCAFSFPLPQVENIENPLSSYGRVEPDNGVHMRVTILEKMLIFLLLFISPECALFRFEPQSLVCLKIVLQDQDNRQVRPTNVGEKSFRCEYEGCGKLYTTAHHLKVSAATSKVCAVCEMLRLQHVALDPPPHPTVLPCRYTSARTPETSRTSASFRAAGRSLRQVPVDVHPMLSAMKSCLHPFPVKMGSEIKFISRLPMSVRLMFEFVSCLIIYTLNVSLV